MGGIEIEGDHGRMVHTQAESLPEWMGGGGRTYLRKSFRFTNARAGSNFGIMGDVFGHDPFASDAPDNSDEEDWLATGARPSEDWLSTVVRPPARDDLAIVSYQQHAAIANEGGQSSGEEGWFTARNQALVIAARSRSPAIARTDPHVVQPKPKHVHHCPIRKRLASSSDTWPGTSIVPAQSLSSIGVTAYHDIGKRMFAPDDASQIWFCTTAALTEHIELDDGRIR